jgi:hypothetical protein
MKPVEFHPHAEIEAHGAAIDYESIRTGLGERFKVELGDAIDRIERNPLMYALEDGVVRFAPLRRFPYAVVYQDDPDRIRIVAVAHHQRRPGYWSDRIE